MKPVNVLLIEDNPADIELVREALKTVELEPLLEIANDFEEAQTHFVRGGCPEVILLDLNLPKGNGLELLQMFRSSPKFQSVPVIVVSSSSAARDRDRAAELGAAHYFRKPTDLDEFMRLGQIVIESLTDQPNP
jgi:two-component system, chemotaxis family, response regulator Rcp1